MSADRRSRLSRIGAQPLGDRATMSGQSRSACSTKRTRSAGFANGCCPRRWVVERSFGWLVKHRRLVRDYGTPPRPPRSDGLYRLDTRPHPPTRPSIDQHI
ncbi:transposase [Nocardia beijingensis]|nr:transposase [Nocardia beijingensis]